MGQHGFARDMEFTLESQASDTIWFKLESNDETLAKFPFAFTLKIGYELSDNAVKVLWNVTNSGNDTLPFSIGAHPAFNCPIGADSSKTGYQISFGKFADATKDAANMTALSQIHHHGNTRDTGLAITEDIVMPLTDGRVTITPDFFDRCTYMIEGNQANSVGLAAPPSPYQRSMALYVFPWSRDTSLYLHTLSSPHPLQGLSFHGFFLKCR